jgi:Ner family transcriptional regulator
MRQSSHPVSKENPQRPILSGWHPEDVKAAIRKKGVTLSELSIRHGYSDAYLRNALQRPIFDAEQIIARFLRTPANQIWPDRYDDDGKPNYAKWRDLQRQRALRRRAA